MTEKDPVVEMIGPNNFEWITRIFNRETTLRDIPDDIIERVASVDITLRNFARDRNAVTSIALLTFAYQMAGKAQLAKDGSKDILLVKVLAKNEKLRREGVKRSNNSMWKTPIFELITGKVGDKIREMKSLNGPL